MNQPFILENMNMELTTECPLQCPFCYCIPEQFNHMPLDTALHWIQEAQNNGIKSIAFSGGEVMCYPYLENVIRAAHNARCTVVLSTSGYMLTKDRLYQLIDAGIDSIHVSLNGSSEEINCLSRNGYGLAREAIKLLYFEKFPNTAINFVLTQNNADDFPAVVHFAESFNIKTISILSMKPDSQKSISLRPTAHQMRNVAEWIDNYHGSVALAVESCYSEMIGLLQSVERKAEFERRSSRVCRAGVYCISVGVDGRIAPCRHLMLQESWTTIRAYLDNSTVIKQLQAMAEKPPNGCLSCIRGQTCRPCLAVRMDTQGSLDAEQPCQLRIM